MGEGQAGRRGGGAYLVEEVDDAVRERGVAPRLEGDVVHGGLEAVVVQEQRVLIAVVGHWRRGRVSVARARQGARAQRGGLTKGLAGGVPVGAEDEDGLGVVLREEGGAKVAEEGGEWPVGPAVGEVGAHGP